MENKTLHTIQVFAKIGRIVSRIIYIFCIVGVVGCGIGFAAALTWSAASDVAFTIGGREIVLHGFRAAGETVEPGTIWAAALCGGILCIGEMILAKSAVRYFTRELSAGTPFTPDGAKELMHLGIKTIVIPIVSTVLAGVAYQVICRLFTGVMDLDLDNFASVGLGVMLIVASLLCRYGAEIADETAQSPRE